MTWAVHKYPVEVADTIKVKLPPDSKLLRFDMQNDKLCLWALVDPSLDPIQTYMIRMAGTGHEITRPPHRMSYINTMFVRDLVFHFFQLV